jgi:hypothetical protein
MLGPVVLKYLNFQGFVLPCDMVLDLEPKTLASRPRSCVGIHTTSLVHLGLNEVVCESW